jgi:hypothetical protein
MCLRDGAHKAEPEPVPRCPARPIEAHETLEDSSPHHHGDSTTVVAHGEGDATAVSVIHTYDDPFGFRGMVDRVLYQVGDQLPYEALITAYQDVLGQLCGQFLAIFLGDGRIYFNQLGRYFG